MKCELELDESDIDTIKYFMQKPYHLKAVKDMWYLLKEWFQGDIVESPISTFPE